MWGAIIGAAASLAGSALSSKGQRDANSANVALSHDQMAFQERMRNTQYQSAVADAEAAGLNPMLIYSQGGNAAPSGAAIAQQNPYSSFADSAGKGVQSAIAAEKLNTEIELAKSATAKNFEDASLAKAAADNKFVEQSNLLANQRLTEASIKATEAETMNKLRSGAILEQNLVTAKGQAARARLETEIDNTRYGEIMRYLDRIPIPFVNSAKGMVGK